MITVENLPDEILRYVFFHVPVNERIFRTNSVCKRWRRLMPYEDFNEFCMEKFHHDNCSSGSWCNLKAAGRDRQLIKIWMKQYLHKLLPQFGFRLTSVDLNFVVRRNHVLSIDADIMQILYENCPHVTRLNLHNCDMTKEAFVMLGKFAGLTHLAIVDDWKVDIADLYNRLPNVTHFDSRRTRPFGHVIKPENLLSIRTDIGSNFFFNLNKFCSRYANVRELYVKRCLWVSPENFSLLAKLGQLKILHLEMQDDLLSDREIQDICAGCPTLTEMSISYTQENGGNNLNLAPLKRLKFLQNLHFNVEYVYGAQLALISDLCMLKNLELSCTEFRNGDDFFTHFSQDNEKTWPNLHRFSAFCKNRSDATVDLCKKVQNSFVKHSKSLQSVGISALYSDSNFQISVLNEYLTESKFVELTEIRLFCNDKEELSRFFETGVFNRLEVMQIQGNAELDVELCESISRCCPNLTDFNILDDMQITVDSCTRLLEECKNLANLKILSSSNLALQLPTENLMRKLGEHRRLRSFEFVKLLPAYHVCHFNAITDGRRRLNEGGLLTHPLYVEANGTFFLPLCTLNDLKAFGICFTNACLIEVKFKTERFT